MTNSTFHKLCYEFDLNYKWNDDFQKHCDDSGIMYVDSMYGNITATTADMKTARDLWVKSKRLWFKGHDEVWAWIDNRPPFVGYAKESDGIAVVKACRKK